MKLAELSPRWISPDVFSFLCPHCKKTTLLCKRIKLSFKEQVKLVNPAPEDEHDWPIDFVPMREDYAWQFAAGADFATLSVEPSIDAHASGHWHGHIRKGEIVGGVQMA